MSPLHLSHMNVFHFRCVFRGLVSASATSQKMMSTPLKDCKGVFCYIDGIIMYEKSEAEHTANLQEVLRHIAAVGLRLNDNCFFNVQELTFLEHGFGNKDLALFQSKVGAILYAPPPTSVTESCSFLELVDRCAKRLHHYVDVIVALYKLL